MASIAIAHGDEAVRQRIGAVLRERGLQVYAVADLDGALHAARQSRLFVILVEPALLQREARDVRPRVRQAAGYQVPLIALIHKVDGDLREALRRHGASLIPAQIDNLVPLADLLEKVAVKVDASRMLEAAKPSQPGVAPGQPAAKPPARGAAKILVVDDEPGFRTFVVEALRSEGYEVEGLSDPVDALAFLERKSFDLVISDVNMPGMDGFELKIQIDLASKHPVPFIAMTADASRVNQGNADAVGAVAFIPKPIRSLDDFYATVRSALGARVSGG